MRTLRWVALVFAVEAASVDALENCLSHDGFDGESTSAPTAAWKQNVDAHNCARRTVLPVASPPLPLLRWSTTLAAAAQTYANQCVYAHSGASGLGENIYAAAPWTSAEKAAVLSWISEAASYSYATNSCSGVCGHYTQVTWRDTRTIGCGIKNCSANTPFGANFPKWTMVVCNYSPAGNVTGLRPY